MFELLVCAFVTFAAAVPVRRWAFQRGLLDIPNHRSSHAAPTPRTGGLACVVGASAALVVARSLSHDVAWIVMVGVGAMAFVGYVDDWRGLSAKSRLAAQVLVGLLIGIGATSGSWLEALTGVVVVPIAVNAVNFMDGINGITSLTMMVWGTTALVAGLDSGLASLSVIGGVTAGAALGFLPWNIPIARLFPGDVGSYLFGALVAGGVVYGGANGVSPVLLAAPLSIYLADTSVVLLKRLRRGSPLFEAHREHVYQRLTSELGISHVAVAFGVATLAVIVTLVWGFSPPWVAATSTFVVCAAYLASPRLLGTRSARRERD